MPYAPRKRGFRGLPAGASPLLPKAVFSHVIGGRPGEALGRTPQRPKRLPDCLPASSEIIADLFDLIVQVEPALRFALSLGADRLKDNREGGASMVRG